MNKNLEASEARLHMGDEPCHKFCGVLRKTYTDLSVAETAELLGVTKNYVYMVERGERSPSKTYQLALILAALLSER
jgi:DNA-binding XRE family transcriptional regulator